MIGRRIGERSTHQVTCTLCGATFGNACEHECKYRGLGLKRYLDSLEAEIRELRSLVTPLDRGSLAPGVDTSRKDTGK
jgi:hypothetical protein